MTRPLLGTRDIAELLGLSRQRVDQLAREDPTFPAPESTLNSRRIWHGETIERWAAATGRLPAPASSSLEPLPALLARACFVIGPIGSKLATHGSDARQTWEDALQTWEEVILPACRIVGLDPVRADGLANAGDITEQIFRRLRDDSVVIADLTGANANVMYELGLRHTRNLLTVQLGEYGRLPFDVATIRTVQFSRSAHGLVSARKELTEILQAGLAGEFDSVTATRIWNTQNDALSTAIPNEPGDESSPAPDELGDADILAEGEAALTSLAGTLGTVSELTGQLGTLAEATTAAIHDSDAAGNGFQGRIRVIVLHAEKVKAIAPALAHAMEIYVDEMAKVHAMVLKLIEKFQQDPSELAAGMDWGTRTRWLASVSRTSLESTAGMAAAMKQNAKLSRVLRVPTQQIVRELDRFQVATAVVDEWDRKLQTLGVPVAAPETGVTVSTSKPLN